MAEIYETSRYHLYRETLRDSREYLSINGQDRETGNWLGLGGYFDAGSLMWRKEIYPLLVMLDILESEKYREKYLEKLYLILLDIAYSEC